MSKLQLLAQKRKQQAAEAALAANPTANPSSTPSPLSNASGSTGLSKLMQKRNLTTENKSSKLSSLLQKKKEWNNKKSESEKIEVSKPEPSIELPDKEEKEEKHEIQQQPHTQKLGDKRKPESELDIFNFYQLHHDNPYTKIQIKPTHILPQLIFSDIINISRNENISQAAKRRKFDLNEDIPNDHNTNNTELLKIPYSLAQKITKNFSNPSPDDNRKVVESLSKDVSKVTLNQEKDVEKDTTKKKEAVATKPKLKVDVAKELERKASKPLLSFIVIGHVDSGKSTTIGRLLYDLGVVDSRTLHKLTKEAELAGKGSFSLAWVMDQTPEERNRGVTVDIVQTQFETPTMRFAVIDSPGHRDYVPQMINGITQADVAVVIIDASSDLILDSSTSNVNNHSISSDASLSEIAKGQTFEQLTIAKNLGIERVLIVVNKMDLVGWDQSRFELIKDSLTSYLVEKLDFSSDVLEFVPTSGFKGDNIVKKSSDCPWYQNGFTVFQHLEKLNETTHKSIVKLTEDSKDPFVLTITDITGGSGADNSNKKSDQLILHGRVNSGMLQPGESVKIWPSAETGQVESVTTTISQIGELSKKNNNTLGTNLKLNEKIAVAGEFVELKIRKIELPDAISIGDVATKITALSEIEISCSQKLTCELRMFGLMRPVLVGTPFVLFRGNVSYSAKLVSIEWVESKITNEDGTIKFKKSKKRKHLSSGQRAKVIIETEKMIPIVNLSSDKKTSENEDGLHGLDKLKRIVLRKEGMTVGAGRIISSK